MKDAAPKRMPFRNVCFTMLNPSMTKEDLIETPQARSQFKCAVVACEFGHSGTLPISRRYLELEDLAVASNLQKLLL